MASDMEKQFSMHVSRSLNCLGKNHKTVKYRVNMYRETQTQFCTIYAPHDFIFAGSKGEGLTNVYESDIDLLFVPDSFICADKTQDFMYIRDIALFQTERRDTPAGYTKLKQVKCEGGLSDMLQDSLFQEESGERYMSSDLFIDSLKRHELENTSSNIIELERRGPSRPYVLNEGLVQTDNVFGFLCICPDILQSFITRPRLYNRPARSILNDISKMEGHVVPVGCKESVTSFKEWRICFTKAELHLLQHFNDIETKLYILLKMISKLLKNVSEEITSYVMKNVVLWLVELYPAESFTEELLTTQLVKALLFLKKSVEVNFLPSYMIPQRNLLAARLSQTQRRKLTTELSTMIDEGGCLLLRCEKLRVMMSILYREPALAEEYRWRRNTAERMSLFKLHCYHHKTALILVVVPEILELCQQGYSYGEIAVLCVERHRQLMS